jgi:hypothetical protein
MKMNFICLLTAVAVASAPRSIAQEGAARQPEQTLMLSKKTYTLKHALAYETTIDNEDAIAVVLSVQPVASDELTKAREAEKNGGDGEFRRPFLRLVFKKTGELKHWSTAAGGTSIGRRSGVGTGELKVQQGRAIGKATLPADPQDMFHTSFDVRFETALVRAADALPASTARKGGPAANVAPSVTGLFEGNGNEAKLAHVSAHWREPFSDKTGMVLVFTEKDHSKEKKPDSGAMFGKYGSALIISLHEDGGIYGCQVVHSAHQKQGFSSIGSIEAPEFTYADGKVEGELTTHGEVDTFGEKWEVKIRFIAPLGEIPKEYQVATKTEAQPAASEDEEDEEGVETLDAQPAAEGLSVKELALTKDARDVEYKDVVEHVLFKSESDVKKVCAELAANLKAQGWVSDGPDMVNPQSSILKRKRGEAALTIFVKPQNGGSAVQMFTEGLEW